ncbi:DUF6653 family protein [Tamilnaduibacter salinus]|nr:DUF6653 family protein [Tamilnaduibacter salinus]
MAMDEASWKRHANPWSVYTRFAVIPIISLALWSRTWIGEYFWVAVALALFWTWLNPRLFPEPQDKKNWASMVTFGERIYLDQKGVEIPAHHVRICRVLQVLSAIGLPVLVYGIYVLDVWITILGTFWVMVFKAWFADRMVWLFLEMRNTDSVYRTWLGSYSHD